LTCGGGYNRGEMMRKDSPTFEAVGTLDELQAVLLMKNLKKIAEDIGRIMSGKKTKVNLVTEIEKLEKKVIPVNKFMIFSNKKAVYLNWVRTIVRRAERRMVKLEDKKELEYLNKLSKYFYLLAIIEEQK
jgi:cob(I)alamin adenosyltransferase